MSPYTVNIHNISKWGKGCSMFVFYFCAIIKHFNQMQHLNEERISSTIQPTAERSQHRKSRQDCLLLFHTAWPPAREPSAKEVQEKLGRNAAGWLVHWITPSANLLLMPGTSLPRNSAAHSRLGTKLPTVGWALLYQSAVKTHTGTHTHRGEREEEQILPGQSYLVGPSVEVSLVCIKLIVKAKLTRTLNVWSYIFSSRSCEGLTICIHSYPQLSSFLYFLV